MISSNNRSSMNGNYAKNKFNSKVNRIKSVNKVFNKRGGIKL